MESGRDLPLEEFDEELTCIWIGLAS